MTTDISLNNHPAVHDINAEHAANLTPLERGCKRVADWTGAPIALIAAIVIQGIWLIVGSMTHWDPYPFSFLLTCSNVLQLVLIFVLAVGQRQSSEHAELRAEHDHDTISRLLFHQEAQESILLALAEKIDCDVTILRETIAKLASDDGL